MNASVLWDIVSRAKIEWQEAAGRVAFYFARDAISHRTRAFIISNRLKTWLHPRTISFLRAFISGSI